jgi:hypothetical protein
VIRNHPYVDLPDYQFWARGVTWAPPGGVDPVTDTAFLVGTEDRVATIGSCFAQHLSRHLSRSGFDYFVPERASEGTSEAEGRRRNFGVFSARYGNVYTVAQAVQLFRRAYGDYEACERPWSREGVVVDPFRPQIEPDGFANEDVLEADRERHLKAVRVVFEESDVLVFTLGLTEAWRSRTDGAVFPVAPGVAGGAYDSSAHEFVNFDLDEVRRDLFEFCELGRSVNSHLRVLLTVSPVPLVATYERRHVLVSTTYSKSVLRVAAAEAARRFDYVDYFPAYEIISSATSPRNYYADDLREVGDLGVAHVMRCFTQHYLHGEEWSPTGTGAESLMVGSSTEVVCDEELIQAVIAEAAASSEPAEPRGGRLRRWRSLRR